MTFKQHGSHHKRPLPIKYLSAWILDIGGCLPYAQEPISLLLTSSEDLHK